MTDYLVQIPELYDVAEFYLMEYDFDLLSGKVNQVDYQRNKGLDSWSHRYHYDANFRITEVETSRDGLHWESQARYSYYIHGPLMRTELGQERVQGLDYAYTINGWLVGVNGINVNQATSDMGRDGSNTGPHKRVARDAFGFALAYFENSYTPIKTGLTHSMKLASLNAATNHRDMYNGNISGMSTSMLDESEVGVVTHYHRYRYDQLNRIKSSRIGDLFSSDGTLPGTYADQASTTYSYDANGNILTLDRYDLNGVQFDDFTYHYGTANNRLGHVSDAILSSSYANDLENGQSSGNYSYDADGNLISDVQEGINSITWNVQGKVSKIDKAAGPDLEFRYDPMGQRQMKIVKNGTLEPNWIKNYYIRDPQGNVMAVYKMNYNPIQISANQYEREYWVDEQHIYGSSRHGVRHTQERIQYREIEVGGYDSNGNIEGYGAMSTTNYSALPTNAIRGITNYELTNHLGNVMSTISDRKVPVNDASNNITYFLPDVDTYQDYFPFGMVMSERSGSESSAEYRYGFNGMERDDEIKGSGNSYDFGARIYDPRLGRWMSIDPAQQDYPFASPYNFALNTPIQAIDPDGKRVYFVAGAGNDPGGAWNYPQRFKEIWESKGISDFKTLNVSHGKWGDIGFTDTWRRDNVVTAPRSAGHIKSIDDKMVQATVNQIVADLAANPLGEGEQLNLAGYSYGSVLQAQVALALVEQGVKVDNLMLIGSPIADDSPLYQKLQEAKENGMIGDVLRYDIEGDNLSNPSSEAQYLLGGMQSSDAPIVGEGDDAPHFDLARPGAEANAKIGDAAERFKEKGVK